MLSGMTSGSGEGWPTDRFCSFCAESPVLKLLRVLASPHVPALKDSHRNPWEVFWNAGASVGLLGSVTQLVVASLTANASS